MKHKNKSKVYRLSYIVFIVYKIYRFLKHFRNLSISSQFIRKSDEFDFVEETANSLIQEGNEVIDSMEESERLIFKLFVEGLSNKMIAEITGHPEREIADIIKKNKDFLKTYFLKNLYKENKVFN